MFTEVPSKSCARHYSATNESMPRRLACTPGYHTHLSFIFLIEHEITLSTMDIAVMLIKYEMLEYNRISVTSTKLNCLTLDF